MLDAQNTSVQPSNSTVDNAEENPEYLDPNRKRTEGYVIQCDSRKAIIIAPVDPSIDYMENYWAVGQQISIWVGDSRVIGQSYKVESADNDWADGKRNDVRVHLELIGQVTQTEKGAKFSTGISDFPIMGCVAHRIRSTDLAAIYANTATDIIDIGSLSQDQSIKSVIDVEKLLSRHFAVVGSTGVGKSTSVTLMLRKIVQARKDIRVLILDPHNEFSSAFAHSCLVINSKDLQLPFWMFGLDEFSEVVFRGQKGLQLEKELLRDLIVLAKQMYVEAAEEGNATIRKKKAAPSNVSADTPTPYRLQDLLKIIDDRLGLLDNKNEKPMLKLLQEKINSISTDIRFRFMFDQNICGGDRIEEVVTKIFRIPQNDLPICVLEMSGLPSEVVSSVVSVLCRMAFELAISSEGAIQTLVVCEEAHRYIPADPNAGFWPTRQAIGRIAKEGRKYGVYLSIITQRPGELDPTILSQCNTFFAMRLSNQKDQQIIEGAFSGGAQSTISFLPSIANRECIAFGEALHSPMRMTFETVAAKDLPGANIRENQEAVRSGKMINVQNVIRHMRKENSYSQAETENDLIEMATPEKVQQRPSQQSQNGEVKSTVPGYVPPDISKSINAGKAMRGTSGDATAPATSTPSATVSPTPHQNAAPNTTSPEPVQAPHLAPKLAPSKEMRAPAPAPEKSKPKPNLGNSLIGSMRGK